MRLLRATALVLPILWGAPDAHAQGRHPFFPEQQGRTPNDIADMLEQCLSDKALCKLDRRVTLEQYALQFGMTPTELIAALRSARTVQCEGTLTSSYIDDRGRISPWTRPCKPGELLAVAEDGIRLTSTGCGNKTLGREPIVQETLPQPVPRPSYAVQGGCDDDTDATVIHQGRPAGITAGIGTGVFGTGVTAGAGPSAVVGSGCK